MHVTFVVPYDSGLRQGGIQTQIKMTLKALQEKGVRVNILTPMTQKVGCIVHLFWLFQLLLAHSSFLSKSGCSLCHFPDSP